jgi:hypothetical protein
MKGKNIRAIVQFVETIFKTLKVSRVTKENNDNCETL